MNQLILILGCYFAEKSIKSLTCRSKVEGALPPHLKSWVGTCPNCPHGSYATGSGVLSCGQQW